MRGREYRTDPTSILEVDPEKRSLDDILTVNFGPNHPSTHGVLRLVVDLDGRRSRVSRGHRLPPPGVRENMEAKSWWKSVTYRAGRYVSFRRTSSFTSSRSKLQRNRGSSARDLGADGTHRARTPPLTSSGSGPLHAARAISSSGTFDDRDEILDLFRDGGWDAVHATSKWWPCGGPPARLHRPGAEVLRHDAQVGRRVREDPRP